MTLKTTSGKVAYWTISWTVIVATLVLSIIYSASTHMRSAIFATDIDGRVYTVDDKGSCGKHQNDIWCLYDENGEQTLKAGPLLSNEYKFIRIRFNHNHYDKKTRTSTLGSYKNVYHRALVKDGFYLRQNTDDNGLQVYEELDSGFKGVRCFSLLIWIILAVVLIILPFIHTNPSKDVLLALMKYAPYAKGSYDHYGDRKNLSFKINDLQVDINVRPDKIEFDDIHYKGERVARHVFLYADGHLENYVTRELYWIERAAKAILPSFSNYMVNLKIEKII